jgi:hypothetical protein
LASPKSSSLTERSVLVAGYELYQAEPVFRTLADRMAEEPRPAVRMQQGLNTASFVRQ